MIRRWILPHARLTTLLVLTAAAMPFPVARSQDRGVQERLSTLEREISMLQRQVYSSGPTPIVPPPPSFGSGAAVDTELRMSRLETQMRDLTGRVEDAVNAVAELRRRLEQINSDVEVRFNQGTGQSRVSPSTSRAAAGMTDSTPTGQVAMGGPMPGTNPPPRPGGTLTPPGTLVPPPPDAPSGIGTFTQPAQAQSPSETAMAGAGGNLRQPSPGGLPTGSISDQYNFALSFIKQADYPAAEDAFRAFLQQHPDHALAGNAQYWLAETYYARHRYAEAASAFAEGYKRYPKAPKAPEDLLKLGMSLARANQKQNACVALAQLDRDFPNPGNAIRDQAAREKKQLGC